MRVQHGLRSSALAAGLLLAGEVASAQASPPAHVSPPAAVRGALPARAGGLEFLESRVFADSALGTAYRYVGTPGIYADVYVYPIPPEVRAAATDVVRSEGAEFLRTLALGPQQGWFDTSIVVYEGPSEVRTPEGVTPSYVAAVALKQAGVVKTSFFAVYVLGHRYVKVRFTGPADSSMVSVAGAFVDDLAAQLDLRVPQAR